MGELREVDVQTIRSLFFSGLGVRAVARISGVSTHTAAKHRPSNAPTQCLCGRAIGHSGRCAERRELHEVSPHSELLKRRTPIETRLQRARRDGDRFVGEFTRKNFPHIASGDLDRARQLMRNHQMPAEFRDDVEADVVLGLLEGRFGMHEIEKALYWITRKYFELPGREVALEELESVKSASIYGQQETVTDAHIYAEAADLLPDVERRVFVMSALDGMNILDIAHEMSFTIEECGQRLGRAYLFVRDFDTYLWNGKKGAR